MDVDERSPTDHPDARSDTDERIRRGWIRPAVLALVGGTVLGGLAVVAAGRGDDTPQRSTIALDAWVPYWAVGDVAPEFASVAGRFREVSPFWFSTAGIDAIGPDANVPTDSAARFLDIARTAGIDVVPSIRDTLPAGAMAAILADPATRTRHVDALVGFVDEGRYDGVDLDYEQFAFADDRSTWATTSTAWAAFLQELSERLHADGKTLTVSVPPIYDGGRTDASGYWVYDYASMAEVVDRIRIMAYDYSTAEPGAIAPIDWVRTSVAAAVEVTGMPEKLVLGVPMYGYNWVTATSGTCPADAETGRTTVTQRALADLLAKRGGTPVHDVVDDEWSFSYSLVVDDGTTSCTQQRTVRYVDEAGSRARMSVAAEAGFGAVSLWALGYEAPTWWAAPLDAEAEDSGG